MHRENQSTPPGPGSITCWLGELKAGNAAAVQPLWEQYFRKLVELARSRLRSNPLSAADEEDVALNAFDSFYRGVKAGRFPQLDDRHGLWKVLVTLTIRNAVELIERANRRKRGGSGKATPAAQREQVPDLDQLVGREPSPELAAQFVEEYQRLLVRLDDEGLRQVAIWKLEGYTVEEIAERLHCTPRTVERKLRVIRSVWLPEGECAP